LNVRIKVEAAIDLAGLVAVGLEGEDDLWV
jgi:hypothetical protein